jgi:hypothetical protein
MNVIPNQFSVNFSIESGLYKKISTGGHNWLVDLSDNTLIFINSNDLKTLPEFLSKNHLKFVPIYSVLRDNSNFPENTDLSQINHLGDVVSPFFCPNNPKTAPLLRNDLESLCELSHIAGIQLANLEMPLIPSSLGCFCSYCTGFAEDAGVDLLKISHEIKDNMKNGANLNWISKKFPEWMKFRMNSISNLAGKLMISIRKMNPDLFLGLNVQFSKTPERLGHNYFFLALYLDLINFVVDGNSELGEKKVLKQILSITKKFIGEYKTFLQMKVPNEFNLREIGTKIARIKKHAFDGLIFHISTQADLEKIQII